MSKYILDIHVFIFTVKRKTTHRLQECPSISRFYESVRALLVFTTQAWHFAELSHTESEVSANHTPGIICHDPFMNLES